MEKYKICPSCKTKNPPALFECMSCEADLTGVKITDAETEKKLTENAEAKDPTPKKMVRLCECGTKNPSNARKCMACDEDISDIFPTADAEEVTTEPVTFVLSSLDGRYAFRVDAEDLIIGRENAMGEYLADKSYVSRIHARLNRTAEELFIENLSSTNFTYVNNTRITGKTKLQDGDELGLGGTNLNGNCQEQAAYFLVRIGSCM